jgi:hypothetical protein
MTGPIRDRIEALEAAQLEQAESHRFCTDAIVRRVEALEAAYEDTAMDELRAASAEARPTVKESLTDGGSLVERVATIITLAKTSRGGAEDVLSEVAKWLRDRYPKSPEASAVAFNLCQEADRG